MFRSWHRSLGYLGLLGISTGTIINISSRYRDHIQGDDTFSQHTRQQQKKHLLSGMHEPFITNNTDQLEIFQKHFLQYSYLFPTNVDTLKKKQSLKTPVQIKSLSECPIKSDRPLNDREILIVGGPPALMTGVSIVKTEKDLTYINDERRIPIAFGSAWHLETDAESEAPTSYRPSQFLIDQLIRATIGYISHSSVEQTGLFPWRTLDWIGWIRHPEHWLSAIKLTLAFQWFAMFDDRKMTLKKVALQCVKNESFFQNLNQELNGQLLLSGKGSIIVARTKEEILELNALKAGLTIEGRILNIISNEDMMNRYGFLPNGLIYGEKLHDRVISPNFMKLLNNYIQQHGGKVINGTLTTIYVDNQETGGIAEYQIEGGQKHLLPFSRLILSLGNQPILKKNNKPLFDIVAARGVSVLAHVYVPNGYRLPPVLVCGETNHATKLTENPVSVKADDGKSYDLYLMRFTAGACITPNVSDESTANYDGTIAVGLISSVRNTFGNQCKIEPIFVYGCNRQVSRHGELRWIEPFPGIHVQYGAGGGGLTRAPDFVARP
jgi:hypothetical protein